MRAVFIALLVLLAGCDEKYSESEHDQINDMFARQNPVGRYQMTPITKGGNVVGVMELDTREGTVRFCQPKPDAAETEQPDCSADSERMDVII